MSVTRCTAHKPLRSVPPAWPGDFDTLNKHLFVQNLKVSNLEAEELVKESRDRKEPVGADERIPHIEGKLNGGDGDLLDVDKMQ